MSTVGEGMAQRRDKADPEGVMTFGDHLDELRRRLLLAILPPLPLAILLFFFAEPIRNFICRPLIKALVANGLPPQLQALSPIETVVLDLKLAVILALVFSAPWLLWQVWCFVAPGLYRHERRFVVFLIPGSAVLMVTGVTLLHFVMLPLVLTMLVSFGTGQGAFPLPKPVVAEESVRLPGFTVPMFDEHPTEVVVGESYLKRPENLLVVVVDGHRGPELLTVPLGRNPMVAQQYRLSEYVSFVLIMTAAMALAFQMPLVILMLGWMDLVRIETLRKQRKWAFFILAVVSAVITPPDIVSMLVTWVPLYGLYEVGVLMLHFLPPSVIAGKSRDKPDGGDGVGPAGGGGSPPPDSPWPTDPSSPPRAPGSSRVGPQPSGQSANPISSADLAPVFPKPAIGTVARRDDLFDPPEGEPRVDEPAENEPPGDERPETDDVGPNAESDLDDSGEPSAPTGDRWHDGNEDDEDDEDLGDDADREDDDPRPREDPPPRGDAR